MKTILSCQFKNTKSHIQSERHRIRVNSSQHMSDVRLKLNKARRHSHSRLKRQLSLTLSLSRSSGGSSMNRDAEMQQLSEFSHKLGTETKSRAERAAAGRPGGQPH